MDSYRYQNEYPNQNEDFYQNTDVHQITHSDEIDDAYTDIHRYQIADIHAYADSDWYVYADGDKYPHRDTDKYAHRDTNKYPHRYRYSGANRDAMVSDLITYGPHQPTSSDEIRSPGDDSFCCSWSFCCYKEKSSTCSPALSVTPNYTKRTPRKETLKTDELRPLRKAPGR